MIWPFKVDKVLWDRKWKWYLFKDQDAERQCVCVNFSRQLVSVLTVIGSERSHDTLTLADTNSCRVTPTKWERPRARLRYRTQFVMRRSDTRVNSSGSAEDVDMSHARLSVAPGTSVTRTIFQPSVTVQIKPYSNAGSGLALTVWSPPTALYSVEKWIKKNKNLFGWLALSSCWSTDLRRGRPRKKWLSMERKINKITRIIKVNST